MSTVRVDVRENDVEQALRRLKKLMNREGLFRELRQRRHYEKPFEKRAREKREGISRSRKAARKRENEM
ncbi:MAG TPA: 30S ribosomal protein S21 [Alphaproteobacteria bacterium]|nr:30S ribosomal protein S21 [Alphaproteobacteria bacterium]